MSDTALIILIGLIIAIPVSMILGKVYKDHAKHVKEGIHFIHHFVPKTLRMPPYTISPYFNRYPDKDRWMEDYWRMCATIDDPFMRELASEVEKECEGKSDAYKAGYILKITQCLYTYEKDSKVYGQQDRWQFPVCTAYLRTGDCEDGAFFGAGLSRLCGLDAIVIYQKGHALYGVCVDGIGMKVTHDGKEYLKCETTSILPLGFTLHEGAVLGTYDVKVPSPDFIEKRTYIDQYGKYKQ